MSVKRDINEIWDAIDYGHGFTSVDELCRAMNISSATAYNYIGKETIPSPIKIGGRRLFINSRLKEYLEQLKEQSA